MDKLKSYRFRGIGASPGVAIGRVSLSRSTSIPRYRIPSDEVASEFSRFNEALKFSIEELAAVEKSLTQSERADFSSILKAIRLLFEDQKLREQVRKIISAKLINAEWAARNVSRRFAKSLADTSGGYFGRQSFNSDFIFKKIIENLERIADRDKRRVSSPERDIIFVGRTISPAEVIGMNRRIAIGFVTEVGGPTWHTAIAARSLRMPAVVGAMGICSKLADGDVIFLDGTSGEILVNPNMEEMTSIRSRLSQLFYTSATSPQQAPEPEAAVHPAGSHMRIGANIAFPEEVVTALDNGAESIGLCRTEHLFTGRNTLPSVDEQYFTYRLIVETMSPRSVVLRTLDLAGDNAAVFPDIKKQNNPSLGLRGIRYSLKEGKAFRQQVRAMLMSGAYGNMKILLPLVSDQSEFDKAKSIILEVSDELRAEKVPYCSDVKIGIMIELPSAAASSDILVKQADFLSIGTNDLIQYFLGIDRANEQVAFLYNPFHPAIIRTLKFVCDASISAGKEVTICGEMANDPVFVPIFLGLKVNEVSMNARFIPVIKKTIAGCGVNECENLLRHILALEKSSEIEDAINEFRMMRMST